MEKFQTWIGADDVGQAADHRIEKGFGQFDIRDLGDFRRHARLGILPDKGGIGLISQPIGKVFDNGCQNALIGLQPLDRIGLHAGPVAAHEAVQSAGGDGLEILPIGAVARQDSGYGVVCQRVVRPAGHRPQLLPNKERTSRG